MSLLVALFLGIVQGLTEFLPISSSGHLVIAERLIGQTVSFEFDVLLNFGTLLALVIFYRVRILEIIMHAKTNSSYAAKLLVAIVPTFIAGFFFGDIFKSLNEEIWVVIFMLLAIGLIMVFFGKERPKVHTANASDVSWRQATTVGIAQMLALVPGTSRSGITILTGLQQKLSAKAAAELSFMLAIPTILGASMKVLLSGEGRDFIAQNTSAVFIGNAASFIAGFAAVSFLIRILSTHGLKAFGYYRIALAFVLGILVLSNTI